MKIYIYIYIYNIIPFTIPKRKKKRNAFSFFCGSRTSLTCTRKKIQTTLENLHKTEKRGRERTWKPKKKKREILP